MGASLDEYVALVSAGSACSMGLVSLLTLLDIFRLGALAFFHTVAQSFVLLLGGLLCLQGETRLFYQYHLAVTENFGFALKPIGRGVVYTLSGLYCIGARSLINEERLILTGFLWYTSCCLQLLGGLASVWTHRTQRRIELMTSESAPDASSLDAYLYYNS
mmetsp:Transcript_26775/g.49200  ORF Transcript_26775/g.49200 Transcript_26775/m.49200 type:complete len:161 (-) Transcript_26775:47-529(-)